MDENTLLLHRSHMGLNSVVHFRKSTLKMNQPLAWHLINVNQRFNQKNNKQKNSSEITVVIVKLKKPE